MKLAPPQERPQERPSQPVTFSKNFSQKRIHWRYSSTCSWKTESLMTLVVVEDKQLLPPMQAPLPPFPIKWPLPAVGVRNSRNLVSLEKAKLETITIKSVDTWPRAFDELMIVVLVTGLT